MKAERMKTREGDRLYRSLRRMFGGRRFGFLWTDDETSYTDGKVIWVKYDMQTPNHRAFTDAELRILRHGHGVHERGHIEFDYLPDWADWQKEMSSTKYEDWEANEKYPLGWCQLFGNFALDGRMERLTVLKLPSQKDYVDFCNYEWRFGDREEYAGEDRIADFQQCYGSRVLGMTDVESWHPEAVDLVNKHQDLIDEIRTQPTTKKCLEKTAEFMEKVWPTLWEWMDLDDLDPEEAAGEPDESHSGSSSWGNSAEEVERNSEKVLDEADEEDDESEEKEPPNFSSIKRLAQKAIEEDEKAVEEEMALEEEASQEIVYRGINDDMKSTAVIRTIGEPNREIYTKAYNQTKRLIKPVAKTLELLLEGTPSQVRRNVRSGRFMPSQAWKAVYCEDTNVFSKQTSGDPNSNAFISFMTDISGSTQMELENGKYIYEEMIEALTLMLEACHLANIPSTAYAFTEHGDTILYRLKPNDTQFTERDRESIGGLYPQIGNRDTVAFKFALDQIRKRDEDIRLLVMLSDGLPIFISGEDESTMRDMVVEAGKEGIDILCLFVGVHEQETIDTVQSMYPGRVVSAQKGIARQLQTHVKRIVRQRRK